MRVPVLGVVLLAVLLLVGMLSGVYYYWHRPAPVSGNRFSYDIESYRRTAPELLRYRQAQTITPGLEKLTAIAIDKDDSIYVAGDQALLVLAKDGRRLHARAMEKAIQCLAIDSDGTIYAGRKDEVALYDRRLKSIAVWPFLGARAYLTAVAVATEVVFVADAGNRLIWRFNKSGKLLGQIGKKDPATGSQGFVIYKPHLDIVLAENETLWAVNPGRHRLEKYSYQGRLLTWWGNAGNDLAGFCGCCNPAHIARRNDGALITSEKSLVRVKLYSASGKFLGVVAGAEQFRPGNFDLDLAIDSAGRVVVMDPAQAVLRIYVATSGT